MFYGRRHRFANPNSNKRGGFSNPNRKNMFHNSIRDKGGYSIFDEFPNSNPSFDENLDAKSALFWIEEIDKLFNMDYIFMEDHVKFVAYKFKRKGSNIVESISKHTHVPR